jgi:hypothetical protein
MSGWIHWQTVLHYDTLDTPREFHRSHGWAMVLLPLAETSFHYDSCDTIHQNTLIEYLASEWEIDEIVLKDCICWTSIARARKQASFAQRKVITKWISGDKPSEGETHQRQQRN